MVEARGSRGLNVQNREIKSKLAKSKQRETKTGKREKITKTGAEKNHSNEGYQDKRRRKQRLMKLVHPRNPRRPEKMTGRQTTLEIPEDFDRWNSRLH